jgi:hypothetical protein
MKYKQPFKFIPCYHHKTLNWWFSPQLVSKGSKVVLLSKGLRFIHIKCHQIIVNSQAEYATFNSIPRSVSTAQNFIGQICQATSSACESKMYTRVLVLIVFKYYTTFMKTLTQCCQNLQQYYCVAANLWFL